MSHTTTITANGQKLAPLHTMREGEFWSTQPPQEDVVSAPPKHTHRTTLTSPRWPSLVMRSYIRRLRIVFGGVKPEEASRGFTPIIHNGRKPTARRR